VGAVVLALAVWVGSVLGLMTFSLSGEVSRTALLQGVWNLAAMTFCLTGVATFISSWSRDRWRAISWAGGFFVVSLIIKVIWRMWPEGDWLKYLTFLSAYRPQELILGSSESGLTAWRCNGTLLALGLLCYVLAALIFTYRDIPGPR
jgi:ABC-type transport system involved in multi-copper enzyme maturation permease subunit